MDRALLLQVREVDRANRQLPGTWQSLREVNASRTGVYRDYAAGCCLQWRQQAFRARPVRPALLVHDLDQAIELAERAWALLFHLLVPMVHYFGRMIMQAADDKVG